MKNRKRSKRFFALTSAVLMCATTMSIFGGCGTPAEDSGYDATKANISVATFTGGVGRAWLDDAIARFEELYKDADYFQEGRVGVKVSLVGDKTTYVGNALAESGNLKKDVYFTEAVDYYTFVNKGMVADISDVVTGSLSTYGESGTIEDKLNPSLKDFMTAKDGKYYMLPFYDGFYGFTYDVDLFEQKGFYFDDDGDFIRISDFDSREEFEAAKSNGPDGVDGTYDDGLPATYDQMIELCDQIARKSCVPFCYSGEKAEGYVNRPFFAYVADYEGYDRFVLNNSFSGTARLVKTITENAGTMEATIEFEDVPISASNGYELQRQAGKYYALKMEEALFGSTKYIGGTFNMTDYTVAQSNFIKSKYTNKPYAMLSEGVWWENEAEPTFVEIENSRGEKKTDRRFGFLPVPKVNAEAAGGQTMFSVNSSFGFINKNCQNMALAKEFMRFLHTDAEMSKFSAKTSIPRSLIYEVDPADRENATYYGKTLIDMRSAAQVVYPFSSANIVIQNPNNFDPNTWFAYSTVGGRLRTNAFNTFKENQANALQYFNGLYTYQYGIWNGLQK